MDEDDWIDAAMTDDTLVAKLLLKLSQVPRPSFNNVSPPPALRLDWTVKQRRSNHVSSRNATRASPTTPLSWSGGTSVSYCAIDGFEESKPIDTARSKVDVVSDRPPKSKRSRKKKTIAELKEAECLLLEERRKLKNQVATLQFTLEKQRHENERLKRFKVDSLSRQTAETGDKSEEIDSIKKIKVTMSMSSCCLHKHKKEVLPDLNLPVDENSDSNMLCGIS